MDNEYYKRYEPFFGAWYIKRYIGAGSYGKVFEIERRDEFDTVFTGALKAITIPSSPDELEEILSDGMDRDGASTYFRDYVKDLNREIALMSKLKGHSNIVSYEDHAIHAHEDGIGWDILIRMELLTPITGYLKQNKSFTRREIIRLGIDLCRALEVCQRYNIIHRDIKPANIFISETEDFKLGDFGVARIASASTGASTRAGTVNYMAPEVFKGEKYTSNVDIYSLGLVMSQLLNANRMPLYPPYPQPMSPAQRERAQAQRLSGAALPPPANADGRLAEIVLKACAPDPAQRYDSPAVMRQALEAILYTEGEARVIYPGGDAVPVPGTSGTADLQPAPAPADDRTVRLMPADVPPAPAPAPEKDHTERVAAPAPQVPEMQDPDKTTVLFAAQAEQRRKQEQTRRDAEEAARRAAEAEKEQARRAAEQAEAARKAAEAAAEKPAPEAKISRRKMLGILGGAAVVAVGVGVGGVAMLNKGEESAAVVASGSCGTNVQWSLDEKGVLRLSGTGRMSDYPDKSSVPWVDVQGQIEQIKFDDEIISVGRYAFADCPNLTKVTLPSALQTIGKSAFNRCPKLISITIPDGIGVIGEYAFTNCYALESVTIPESVRKIKDQAFRSCDELKSVKINKSCTLSKQVFPDTTEITYY